MMIWRETNTPPFFPPFFPPFSLHRWSHNDCKHDKNSTNRVAEGIARRTCKGPVAMILHFIRRQRQGLPASGSAFMSTRTLHTISAGGESYHIISIVLQSSKRKSLFSVLKNPRGVPIPVMMMMCLMGSSNVISLLCSVAYGMQITFQ